MWNAKRFASSFLRTLRIIGARCFLSWAYRPMLCQHVGQDLKKSVSIPTTLLPQSSRFMPCQWKRAEQADLVIWWFEAWGQARSTWMSERQCRAWVSTCWIGYSLPKCQQIKRNGDKLRCLSTSVNQNRSQSALRMTLIFWPVLKPQKLGRRTCIG